jgi:hypothetical protein
VRSFLVPGNPVFFIDPAYTRLLICGRKKLKLSLRKLRAMKGKPLGKDDVKTMGSIFVHSDDMGRFDFGPDHPIQAGKGIKNV